jgi:hypothetical protein
MPWALISTGWRGSKGNSRPANAFHAILPRQTPIHGLTSESSAIRWLWQFAISAASGSRLRPRRSRGLQRTTLVMKTLRSRACLIIRLSNSPDRSPSKGIPVRSPPKRPGASPINATAAGTAPWPGTTRDRDFTRFGQRPHASIVSRKASNAAVADEDVVDEEEGVDERIRKGGSTQSVCTSDLSTAAASGAVAAEYPAMEYAPHQSAANGSLGQVMELAPQALPAHQVERIVGQIRPRDAPNTLCMAAKGARIDYAIGTAGVGIFNESHFDASRRRARSFRFGPVAFAPILDGRGRLAKRLHHNCSSSSTARNSVSLSACALFLP